MRKDDQLTRRSSWEMTSSIGKRDVEESDPFNRPFQNEEKDDRSPTKAEETEQKHPENQLISSNVNSPNRLGHLQKVPRLIPSLTTTSLPSPQSLLLLPQRQSYSFSPPLKISDPPRQGNLSWRV